MGSKKLKAIHVKASSKGQSSPELREEIKRLNHHLRKDPKMQGLIDTGTVFLMRIKISVVIFLPKTINWVRYLSSIRWMELL